MKRKRKNSDVEGNNDSKSGSENAGLEQAPNAAVISQSATANEVAIHQNSADPTYVGEASQIEFDRPDRPLHSSSLKEEISFYERSILALTKRNKKILLKLSQARYAMRY